MAHSMTAPISVTDIHSLFQLLKIQRSRKDRVSVILQVQHKRQRYKFNKTQVLGLLWEKNAHKVQMKGNASSY